MRSVSINFGHFNLDVAENSDELGAVTSVTDTMIVLASCIAIHCFLEFCGFEVSSLTRQLEWANVAIPNYFNFIKLLCYILIYSKSENLSEELNKLNK